MKDGGGGRLACNVRESVISIKTMAEEEKGKTEKKVLPLANQCSLS